jgi:hypothetical protein
MSRNILLAILIVVLGCFTIYMLDPTLFGVLRSSEGYANENLKQLPESMRGETAQKMVQPGNAQAAAVLGNPHVAAAAALQQEPTAAAPVGAGADVNEGFANLQPEAMPFPAANTPTNCYPKNQLAPQELLPNDPNSKWAQVNPMASGDIAGKNLLNAGTLIGVNTVGQSNRNANWDIRSVPPNPQVLVSPWMQTTISPDLDRRPLE